MVYNGRSDEVTEETYMGRLEGKVAIITGGAKGQGAVEVELFANEGATVVFGDVLDDEGRKVEARVAELGVRVEYIHLDVTSEEDWQQAVDLAESKYGSLDILVNNAGITMRHQELEITSEDWDRVMDVNAQGGVPGNQVCRPRDASGRRRLDSQHILDSRYGGTNPGFARLRGVEGRRARVHEVHCRPLGCRQDKGQLHTSGPHRHGHDPGDRLGRTPTSRSSAFRWDDSASRRISPMARSTSRRTSRHSLRLQSLS